MKFGLLGGSFNPVHNAHLQVATDALQACHLDKVFFIPAANPPHKPVADDVAFDIRSSMVQMAIADSSLFELSTIEAERSGKSYSVDTLKVFRDQHPEDELYFIIGGDSFLEIGTWYRYEDIFALCNIIVVARPGAEISDPFINLPDQVRSSFARSHGGEVLIHTSGHRIYFITGSPQEISSTGIRRLAATGGDITHYLPQRVAAYIIRQRIYKQCQ